MDKIFIQLISNKLKEILVLIKMKSHKIKIIFLIFWEDFYLCVNILIFRDITLSKNNS